MKLSRVDTLSSFLGGFVVVAMPCFIILFNLEASIGFIFFMCAFLGSASGVSSLMSLRTGHDKHR